MAAEAAMLSPMPCKSICTISTTSPYSPSEIDVQELNAVRPFWYEVDEATQDLLDVLTTSDASGKILPDWMPAFQARSLSSASTCALSPPPRFNMSEPSSPDRTYTALSDLDLESPTHAQPEQPQCPPGALDKSSWLMARKVFVGGIPQSIDQNGLYQLFSKVGKVKKAWLQLFHNDRASHQIPTGKKHRGFGFVIFYEKQAIDQILGNEDSRFISFENDINLEVKRAFGKTSVRNADDTPSAGKPKKAQVHPLALSPGPQSKSGPLAAPASSQGLQTPQSGWTAASPSPPSQTGLHAGGQWIASGPSPALQPSGNGPWAASSVPSTPQTSHNGGFWAAPQWQGPVVVAFPYVPPFPAGESQMAQPTQSSQKAPATDSTAGQQSNCPLVPGVFFQGFVGPKPIDSQELTRALLEAMPDHYED